MKIQIDITKEEAEHMREHTFYDECKLIADILVKVRKQVRKKK